MAKIDPRSTFVGAGVALALVVVVIGVVVVVGRWGHPSTPPTHPEQPDNKPLLDALQKSSNETVNRIKEAFPKTVDNAANYKSALDDFKKQAQTWMDDNRKQYDALKGHDQEAADRLQKLYDDFQERMKKWQDDLDKYKPQPDVKHPETPAEPPPTPPTPGSNPANGAPPGQKDDDAAKAFKAAMAVALAALCVTEPELCAILGPLADLFDIPLFPDDPKMTQNFQQVVRDAVIGREPNPDALKEIRLAGLKNNPKAIEVVRKIYEKLPEGKKREAEKTIGQILALSPSPLTPAVAAIKKAMEDGKPQEEVRKLLGGSDDKRFYDNDEQKEMVLAVCSAPDKDWMNKYWNPMPNGLAQIPVKK